MFKKRIIYVLLLSLLLNVLDFGCVSAIANPAGSLSENTADDTISNDANEDIITDDMDTPSTDDSFIEEDTAEDNISDNTVSEDAISDNSVSNDAVSSNEVSDNSVSMSSVSDDVISLSDNLLKNKDYLCSYVPNEWDYDTPVLSKKAEKEAVEDELSALGEGAIPTSYHDTPSELNSIYPTTRNQNPWGTCWAHSAIAAAEFSMINDGHEDENVDYSELQLAYFTTNKNNIVDSLGGTVGDNNYSINISGVDDSCYLETGNNTNNAMRALIQWMGAVDESDVPYGNATSQYAVPTRHAYGSNQAILTDARLINIKTNPDMVKAAIMESGLAVISYCHDNSYYSGRNSENYYCPVGKVSNHSVAIVGWDDDYSRNNFTAGARPSRDGAWLIRNSWDDTYMTNTYSMWTYFWMSYDDKSITDTAYQLIFSPADTFDNNYQYDGGLRIVNPNMTELTTKAANIYTVKGISSEYEVLSAVNVFFGYNTNVGYTIDVYTDCSYSNPISGTRQVLSTTSGTTENIGYYTIELNEPVILKKGQNYSVVVTTNKGALAFEYGSGEHRYYTDTGNRYNDYEYVRSASGQSWYYGYNRWNTTAANGTGIGNFCLKAYTNNADAKKLILNPQGGNCSIANKAIINGYKYGSLPVPTRKGYNFDGWFDSAVGGSEIHASDVFGGSADMTAYAHWTAKNYTITFDVNGGDSVPQTSKSVTYDQQYGTLPTPNKTGYVFCGWYTARTGGAVINSTDIVTTDRNATLYARWRPNKYTLVFNTNGGSDVFSDMEIYYDSKYCSNQSQWPVPQYNGYYFKGWSMDSPSSGKMIRPADVVRELKADGSTITLYGIWDTTCYNISFDAGIGGNIDDVYDVEIGKKYSLNSQGKLPSAYAKGYIFDGWYTEVSGGEKIDDNTCFYEVGNQTLYAHYTKIGFAAQSYDVVIGKKLNIALNVPGAKYKSSKKNIAKIDGSGNVKGLKKGKSKITAVYDGVTYSCAVKVVNKPVLKGVKSLKVKKTAKFKVKDGSGPISWMSSNPSVATVDGNGKVKAIKKGSTTITAIRNGIKMKIKLKVVK